MKHTCKSCGKAFESEAPHAPFCSDRCRLLDLGSWVTGKYRIVGPPAIDPEAVNQAPLDDE